MSNPGIYNHNIYNEILSALRDEDEKEEEKLLIEEKDEKDEKDEIDIDKKIKDNDNSTPASQNEKKITIKLNNGEACSVYRDEIILDSTKRKQPDSEFFKLTNLVCDRIIMNALAPNYYSEGANKISIYDYDNDRNKNGVIVSIIILLDDNDSVFHMELRLIEEQFIFWISSTKNFKEQYLYFRSDALSWLLLTILKDRDIPSILIDDRGKPFKYYSGYDTYTYVLKKPKDDLEKGYQKFMDLTKFDIKDHISLMTNEEKFIYGMFIAPEFFDQIDDSYSKKFILNGEKYCISRECYSIYLGRENKENGVYELDSWKYDDHHYQYTKLIDKSVRDGDFEKDWQRQEDELVDDLPPLGDNELRRSNGSITYEDYETDEDQ